MKLSGTEINSLYGHDFSIGKWRYRLNHKKATEKLESLMKDYKGKNLLVLSRRKEMCYVDKDFIADVGFPFLAFGEYDSLQAEELWGDRSRLSFLFKRPFLYADINLKKNVEKSSVRFRWYKSGNWNYDFEDVPNRFRIDYRDAFDELKAGIRCLGNFGLVYKGDLILDAELHKIDVFQNMYLHGRYRDHNLDKSNWDIVSEIFEKRVGAEPNYENLYSFFEQKYMTNIAHEPLPIIRPK